MKFSWKLFQQNYCHACHRRFAVFFSLPSCCLSSLLSVWQCVLVPADRVVMVTSRAALRLPPFDQAPFPHPCTGEGFNQGPKLRHVFFILKYLLKFSSLSFQSPLIFSTILFYYNNSHSVDKFFVFLASPFARHIFPKKNFIPINKIIIHCTYCVPSHWRRASSLFWK